MTNGNCTSCNEVFSGVGGQWWHCTNYHKFTGFFCPDCWSKIRHDSFGNPADSEGYLLMLLKSKDVDYASS